MVPASGYSEGDSAGPLNMRRAHFRLQSELRRPSGVSISCRTALHLSRGANRDSYSGSQFDRVALEKPSILQNSTQPSPPGGFGGPPKGVAVPFAVLMPFAWPETETTYYPWVVYGSSGAGVIAPWSLSRRLLGSPPPSTIWIRLHPTNWAAIVHSTFQPGGPPDVGTNFHNS